MEFTTSIPVTLYLMIIDELSDTIYTSFVKGILFTLLLQARIGHMAIIKG